MTAVTAPTAYSRFPLIHVSDLQRQLDSKWLIRDLLPGRGLTFITGPEKSGKSIVATQMAASIALGLPWGGKPSRQAPVLYIDTAQCSNLPARLTRAVKERRTDSADTPLMAMVSRPDLSKSEVDILYLIESIQDHAFKPGCIIIDPLSLVLGDRSPDDNEAVAGFLKNVAYLSSVFDCSVIAIHGSPLPVRGTMALYNAADCILEVLRFGKEAEVMITKQRDGVWIAPWRVVLGENNS